MVRDKRPTLMKMDMRARLLSSSRDYKKNVGGMSMDLGYQSMRL
jgi:hypothetical protein